MYECLNVSFLYVTLAGVSHVQEFLDSWNTILKVDDDKPKWMTQLTDWHYAHILQITEKYNITDRAIIPVSLITGTPRYSALHLALFHYSALA
jgi:hypothetical protein